MIVIKMKISNLALMMWGGGSGITSSSKLVVYSYNLPNSQHIYTFRVPCCDVCYDFCIKTMFGSSLPPVVCKRAHCLTYLLFVFVCAIVVSNTYGIVFLFYFSSSCVPYVASFYGLYILIITSVFSNVYIVHFDYHFGVL